MTSTDTLVQIIHITQIIFDIYPNILNIYQSSQSAISSVTKLFQLQVLKQVIGTFEIHPCVVHDIYHYWTKIDRTAFYGEPYVSGGVRNKYLCAELHGGAQAAKNKNFKHFKNDICEFLICTDVAARCIDVEPLSFVMNDTMTSENENYMNRSGSIKQHFLHISYPISRTDCKTINTKRSKNNKDCVWLMAMQ